LSCRAFSFAPHRLDYFEFGVLNLLHVPPHRFAERRTMPIDLA
jgi:hypothetical protein